MKKMEAKKEDIKKGPWKAEEDEVLINHVKRYGPRDWSSIRSKGLLKRTGKSCRLRWVNKLRPNLKNGCKFSIEEERTVIELQMEFGNKWARIATYLPGRTDNDVKNFWSSRQKRLKRAIPNSSDACSSSHNNNPKSSSHRSKGKNVKTNPPQVQGFGLVEEEIGSEQVDENLGFKLDHHQPYTFGTDLVLAETTTTATSVFGESQIANQQGNITFSPDSRELLARIDDAYFYDILGPADSSDPLFALPQPFFEPSPAPRRCRHKDEEPDGFLDDFPADIFDQADPIRGPD